ERGIPLVEAVALDEPIEALELRARDQELPGRDAQLGDLELPAEPIGRLHEGREHLGDGRDRLGELPVRGQALRLVDGAVERARRLPDGAAAPSAAACGL